VKAFPACRYPGLRLRACRGPEIDVERLANQRVGEAEAPRAEIAEQPEGDRGRDPQQSFLAARAAHP
jgi:hypothetical protein